MTTGYEWFWVDDALVLGPILEFLREDGFGCRLTDAKNGRIILFWKCPRLAVIAYNEDRLGCIGETRLCGFAPVVILIESSVEMLKALCEAEEFLNSYADHRLAA